QDDIGNAARGGKIPEPLLLRAEARDEDADARQAFTQDDRRLDQYLERFLGPEQADGSGDRRSRKDPELGADVAPCPLKRGDPVPDHANLPVRDALDLDHAPVVLLRHRDDRAGAHADEPAVEEPPQRLTLERPGVLVSDHDRDADYAPENRPPDVRPELVRVEDVD